MARERMLHGPDPVDKAPKVVSSDAGSSDNSWWLGIMLIYCEVCIVSHSLSHAVSAQSQ